MGLAKEEEELITCAYHNSVVPRLAARFKLPDRRRERRAELYAQCFRKITQHARSTSHSRVGYLHVSHPTSWQLLLIPYICWILANKIHAIWEPSGGLGPPNMRRFIIVYSTVEPRALRRNKTYLRRLK